MNMGRLMRWIPLMLVVVMAVSVASRMRGPAVDADGVDWNAVGSLAVSAEGGRSLWILSHDRRCFG